MNTSTVYQAFALQHKAVLAALTKRVREAAPVNALYLLGLTTSQHRTETLFSLRSVTSHVVTHAYLLALVENGDDGAKSRVQDMLEGRLQDFLPLTAIVLSGAQFAAWLLEGHPFAVGVQDKGYLLYQQEGFVLPEGAVVAEEGRQKEAAQLASQTRVRVQEFLAGAELYTVRVQYKLAAFMLHQAAEQALRTALIVNTGLVPNTHSIDRLVRCCGMFCPRLADVLPRRNEMDKRLFGLLQKAYIEARYGKEYSIKAEELRLLMERVKGVVTLMEKR